MLHPRTHARWWAGSGSPRSSRAVIKVAKSFTPSRGGTLTQRVSASTPSGPEPIEAGLDRLYRVQVTLARRVQTRGGGAEGVEKRDLDEVVALGGGSHEFPCLRHVDAYPRMAVEVTGEPGEVLAHQSHHLGIDLDRVHLPRSRLEGLEDPGPAARTEHEHLVGPHRPVRERGGRLREVAQGGEVAFEAGDDPQVLSIGEHADLGRDRRGGGEAQTRRMTDGDAFVLERGEHPRAGWSGFRPRARRPPGGPGRAP